MGELRNILKDLYANTKGLGENALMLGTSAIAEPVAGYAAMFDPVNGAQAIREGMTYQPRTEAGRMYQQGVAQAVGKAVKPVMPVVDTWQKGVDIAGRYSPTLGALMQTAPTALGVALGAKPTLQAGRQASNTLGAMQARMIANANAPRTLNTGFMGQRGSVGTQRPLTEFEKAHLIAQQNAALPVSQGGLGLAPDNTAMDRARAMGFDVDNKLYTGISPREDYGKSGLWNKLERKTDPNMTGFDRSVFSSTSPIVASSYTGIVNLSPDLQHRIAFDGLTEAKKLKNAEGFQPTFIGDKMLEDLGDDFTFNDVKNYLSDNDISPGDIMEFSKVIDTDKYHDIGSSVIPMYANKNDYLNLDADGSNWDEVIRAGSYDEDDMLDSLVKQIKQKTGKNITRDDVLSERGIEYDGQMDRNITTDDLKEITKDHGLSGVEIKNVFDSTGNKRLKANTIATTKGNTLRSIFAAFDPMKRDSANLLADAVKLAPATTLGAYMYNEKQKQKK